MTGRAARWRGSSAGRNGTAPTRLRFLTRCWRGRAEPPCFSGEPVAPAAPASMLARPQREGRRMRRSISLALSALIVLSSAAPVAVAQSQEELRQLAFMQREMDRQRRAYEARLDALLAANEQLSARVDQITQLVSAPSQNTSIAEARGAETEARYAAAALIVDGAPEEQRAAELLASGDVRGGFALLEQAAAQGADSAAERWRRLGALAYEADVQTALRAYSEAARLSPNDPDTLTRLCVLQSRTANLAGARQTCAAALRVAVRDKDRLQALIATDAVYSLTGEHSASEAISGEIRTLARSVFEAEPSIDSMGNLLNILTLQLMTDAGLGNIDAVLVRAGEIAALAQEDIPGVDPATRDARLLRSDMVLAAAYAHMTDPSRMLGAFEESIAILREVAVEHPNHTLTQMRLWDRHNGRAGIYQLMGDTAAALREYDEAERIARAMFDSDPTDSAKAIILISTVLMSMQSRFSDPAAIEDGRARLADVDARLAALAAADREHAMFEVMYAFVHAMVGIIDEVRRMQGVSLDHDPRAMIEEARAVMAPHLESGRVPPEMRPLWTQLEMLIRMMPAEASPGDASP
ncbi:MAG: tetratricopeptide repeat protein [Alphaproteobacteria bacterium]|nr:tetratricopeptide repeat protein [Alphaproteobacteria bacterium]